MVVCRRRAGRPLRARPSSGIRGSRCARMADRKLVGTAVVACLSLEDRLARSVEPVAGARSLGRYRQ